MGLVRDLRDAPRGLAACGPARVREAGPAFDPAQYPHEAVACNLCGADDAAVVAEKDRYGLPTRIVQCQSCGLRYVSPRMTAEGYAAFYRDGYRKLLTQLRGRTQRRAEFEAEQWRYALDLAEEVAPFIAGSRLLDVGGSTGVVGRLFGARWGFDVTVLDPAPDELERAINCERLCVSAEDAEFPPADVALLCRAIDHLRDPLGVLRRLRERVRTLVVDAMDVDRWPLVARYKVDHPYAFTADTLRQMVEAAGWRVRHRWERRGGKYVGLLAER